MPAKYLWLDLETTGLDVERCTILEVAAIVTDEHLVELSQFQSLVRPVGELLMSVWPWKQHEASGLLNELDDASPDLAQVDSHLRVFLGDYPPLQLAGSSVHFDRAFMRRHMPQAYGLLHYRQVDVSTIKTVAQDWWPELKIPEPVKAHRAIDDILESLALARFFKDNLKA